MGFIKTLVACFLSVLAMTTIAEAKEWRGIIPLRSTRADVERLLGSHTRLAGPPERLGIYSDYETKTERISIFYSRGPCIKGITEWMVPRDTVIDIFVDPKKELPVSEFKQLDDLKLDSPKFRKISDPHNESSFYYINHEEGVFVSTSESYRGQFVTNVIYRPAAADSHLRCPNSHIPSDKDIFDPHLPPPPPTVEPSPSPSKRQGTRRTSSKTRRRSSP